MDSSIKVGDKVLVLNIHNSRFYQLGIVEKINPLLICSVTVRFDTFDTTSDKMNFIPKELRIVQKGS